MIAEAAEAGRRPTTASSDDGSLAAPTWSKAKYPGTTGTGMDGVSRMRGAFSMGVVNLPP